MGLLSSNLYQVNEILTTGKRAVRDIRAPNTIRRRRSQFCADTEDARQSLS